ncbi:MAG: S24/S26 family peptidase [Bdellovibrionia bacterium]
MSLMKIDFKGESMWPFLSDGDRLLVETSERMSPSRGEIWLLRTRGREWIAHRFLGDGVFKGDFSTCFEPADEFQVWGRVVGREREGFSDRWPEGIHPFAKTAAWLSERAERGPTRWLSLSLMWLAVRLSNRRR